MNFVNNKGVMSATTEAGTNSNPLFGGQDQFQILFNSADKIDMSIASEYDARSTQTCRTQFRITATA